MTADAKLDRLRAAPLFARCNPTELVELASAIETVDLDAGKTILRQGLHHGEGYVIEEGVAEVFVDGELVAEIPAGQTIGEIGLLTGDNATATVVAKTAMTLMMIPRSRFQQVLADTPGLALSIAEELARRLKATDEKLH